MQFSFDRFHPVVIVRNELALRANVFNMSPFPATHMDRAKRRDNHARADFRIVLVGALCLLIGFGLGRFRHSRRTPPNPVETETEADLEVEAPTAPVPPLPAAASV